LNRSRLRDLGRPVTTVEAENTGREAHKASHEDAENLYQTVFLAIGARVRLTQNVQDFHQPLPNLRQVGRRNPEPIEVEHRK